MSDEIQQADPKLRRVTAVVLALATVLAIWLVIAFRHWIVRSTASMPSPQLIGALRLWVGVTTTAIGLCFLLLAAYAARLGRMTRLQRRWPPASTRVLVDTPVRRDERALALARNLDIAALALVFMGAAAAFYSWQSFSARG